MSELNRPLLDKKLSGVEQSSGACAVRLSVPILPGRMAAPVIWILLAGFCFGCMSVLVKYGSSSLSGAELVFYRSLTGLALLLPVAIKQSRNLKSPQIDIHLIRGLIGAAALIVYYMVIAYLPISIAVMLIHTAPIFLIPLAVIILKERPTFSQSVAIAGGFLGVLLLLRPVFTSHALIPFLGGISVGVATAIGYVNLRQLGVRGEPEWRTVLYFTLICTVVSGVYCCYTGFHHVNKENVWIILGVGLAGSAAEFARTRAYRHGKTLFITTLTYSNVLFATLLGALILRELPTPSTWLAFLIIAVSGVLASRSKPQ